MSVVPQDPNFEALVDRYRFSQSFNIRPILSGETPRIRFRANCVKLAFWHRKNAVDVKNLILKGRIDESLPVSMIPNDLAKFLGIELPESDPMRTVVFNGEQVPYTPKLVGMSMVAEDNLQLLWQGYLGFWNAAEFRIGGSGFCDEFCHLTDAGSTFLHPRSTYSGYVAELKFV